MNNFVKHGLKIKKIANGEINAPGIYFLDEEWVNLNSDCTLVMQNFNQNSTIKIRKGKSVNIYLLDILDEKDSINSNIEVIADPEIVLNFFRYTIIKTNSQNHISAKLIVSRDSENCDLGYVHKNLCLNENFDMVSRPELIIENGNVKCRHSSSFQSVPKNVLQYLKSRGLNQVEIEAIYEESFIQELCNLVLTK